MKKILFILFCTLLAFGLINCSSDSTDDAGDEITVPPTPEYHFQMKVKNEIDKVIYIVSKDDQTLKITDTLVIIKPNETSEYINKTDNYFYAQISENWSYLDPFGSFRFNLRVQGSLADVVVYVASEYGNMNFAYSTYPKLDFSTTWK
jgi:hypothetical protein